jgi:tRNA-dihydrouridine synthase
VQNGEFYRPQQCNDLLPEHNKFQKPVPQFLGKDAISFRRFEELCLEQNYSEVNINMGCPYPMVTGKGMGAGLLSNPSVVNEFLENVFTNTQLKISIKCRLGMESTQEFEPLIPIFNQFPLLEIIIHTRIGKQQYKGEANMEAFAQYAKQLQHPICYNGDIVTAQDLEKLRTIAPQTDRIMIGRGVLQHPFLVAEIRKNELTSKEKIRMLRNFHMALIENSKKKYSGDLHFLKRFEEFWSYHSENFENGHKIHKLVKKCKTLAQYEAVVFKAINELE